jgi:Lrp/AsnC family leucine-responsive transcriptional regulator
MDNVDYEILSCLSAEGRMSNVELAKQIGTAPSATFNRTRKLEQAGVISSYHAKLNPNLIGAAFLTFISIKTNAQSNAKNLARALAAIPQIIEVHQTAGDACFLIKVRTEGTRDFAELLNEKISKINGVAGTKTIITLSTFKENINPL